MDEKAIRERVMQTDLLQSLPAEMQERFIQLLLSVSEAQDVSRQQKLFIKGDKDDGRGCIILEGMVQVKLDSGEAKHIEGPDIMGEVQLFTPEGERTATVEVVVGGTVLSFSWKALGSAAREEFLEDEFETLKKAITNSASRREQNLFSRTQDL